LSTSDSFVWAAPTAPGLGRAIACPSAVASPALPPGTAGTLVYDSRSTFLAEAFDASVGSRNVVARQPILAIGSAALLRFGLPCGSASSRGSSRLAHRRVAHSAG